MLEVSAKCNDMCDVTIGGTSIDGYVPDDLGIGGGDYVKFRVRGMIKMTNEQIHQMALTIARADNEYRGYNHAGLPDFEQPMSWYSNHVESWAWYCYLAECALQHFDRDTKS